MSSVSILGMGSTLFSYLQDHERDYRRPTDAVWAINSVGAWLHDIDLIIALDNFRRDMRMDGGQHIPYVQNMLRRGKPIISDVADPEWPQVEAYPLREVIANIWPDATRADQCAPWLQNTVNYALALALTRGFEEIRLYGCNFLANDNAFTLAAVARDDEENNVPWWFSYHRPAVNKGRRMGEPGLETTCWLLGIAHARGCRIWIPQGDSLMNRDRNMYWYGFEEQPDPFMENDIEIPMRPLRRD